MTDVMAKPHQLIASDRVEGTAVRRPNGDKIGHIERLMIDKITGKVSYAILSFGGFLGMGTNLLPLPWARLTYNPRFEAYQLDIDDEELKRAPSFRADKDFDWGDRSQEASCIAITEYRPTGAVSDRGLKHRVQRRCCTRTRCAYAWTRETFRGTCNHRIATFENVSGERERPAHGGFSPYQFHTREKPYVCKIYHGRICSVPRCLRPLRSRKHRRQPPIAPHGAGGGIDFLVPG